MLEESFPLFSAYILFNVAYAFIFLHLLQRKHDTLMKEKNEVIKENQSLLKQMEDLKSRISRVLLHMHLSSFNWAS
jgi:vacuolar-type H+-ATPase subunit D/Vma8